MSVGVVDGRHVDGDPHCPRAAECGGAEAEHVKLGVSGDLPGSAMHTDMTFAAVPRQIGTLVQGAASSSSLGRAAVVWGEEGKTVTHLGRHGLVDGAPPHVAFRALLLDNALVGGRTASLGARVGGQGSGRRDGRAGLVDEGVFIQGGDGGVGDLGRGAPISTCARQRYGGQGRLTMATRS